jgi:hypothetical protein
MTMVVSLVMALAVAGTAVASGHSHRHRRLPTHARRHVRKRKRPLKRTGVQGLRPRSGRGRRWPSAATSPVVPTAPTNPEPILSKTACVYSSSHISLLDAFGSLVGRSFQCAMVYNDTATDWASWVDPWFISTSGGADVDWAKWATTPGTHRELIITQNLFPSSEDSADWLELGASGAFEGYARELAENLVNAGLGWSVIRLGHEANGNWYPDSIPDTAVGDDEWIEFWRNTAEAMRSVAGAHFLFDWTVNAGYRDVPLSSFYPGNDVVNIIGVDAYDVDASDTSEPGWPGVYTEPDGLEAVAAFAAANGKPLSIPEWGLLPSQQAGGSGDDPTYVDGIAAIVADNNVAYESYFDGQTEGPQFFNSPESIAAYVLHFGPDGNAVAATARGVQSLTPSPGPALAITGGPGNAATLASDDATFTFAMPSTATAECSLDLKAFLPCTSQSTDTLTGLANGFHSWRVEAVNSAGDVSLLGRAFVVASSASASSRREPQLTSPVPSFAPTA